MMPGIDQFSHEHFISSLKNADKEIIFMGLTCNFYVKNDEVKKIITEKSHEIPVTILILHPQSKHRVTRYEMEPNEAKYHEPSYFKKDVIERYKKLKQTCHQSDNSKLGVYLYDLPPLFGLELIDDIIRVRLYGYLKRGTDSPIFVAKSGSSVFDYFESQVRLILENEKLTPIGNIE